MQKYTKTTSRTSAWIKNVSDGGRLVLAPPYQRNPVWTEKQQSSLIETMLLEYPIPELYMQDVVSEIGSEQHIVVDGQQRVREVLDYTEGLYSLSEDLTLFAGFSFDDLPLEQKKKIFEYDFVVRVLPEIDNEQIRSIFQRINRTNVVLNAQELRHATYWGEFIKTIESIADYDQWEVFGVFTATERRRMIDSEFVSEIAVAHLNGLQNKKAKLEEFYRLYETNFSEGEALKRLFQQVLGELEAVLPDLRSTRWKKKSDFYTLFLVMSSYQSALPLSRDGRTNLRAALLNFSSEVTSYIRMGESSDGGQPSMSVIKYAMNVERAASDLSARRNRRDALLGTIKPILDEESVNAGELSPSAESPSIG